MESRLPIVSPDRVGIERVSSVRAMEIPDVFDSTGLKTIGAPPDQILPDFLHPPLALDRFVTTLQSEAMGDNMFAPSEYDESLAALRTVLAGRLLTVAALGPGKEVIQRAIQVLERELELRDLLGYMRNALHRA
jgi:hypothetical protein